MFASYHNHTTWSDGKGSVTDMVARARELGLDEIGISDHLVLSPDGNVPHWSLPSARLAEYVADVQAQAGTGTPVVRLGLEVDWFPGRAELIREALADLPLDLAIGSVHEVEGFVVDFAAKPWHALGAAEQDAVHRGYWESIRSLAASGLFDAVGHLDLPKKFGRRPHEDLDDLIGAALDAIQEADLVVELNTSGWYHPCGDAYPSLPLLEACHDRGIPVMLSADAHTPEHVARDFDRGVERLRAAGYREIARFERRRRSLRPLPGSR